MIFWQLIHISPPDFTWEKLIIDAKEKFNWHIDPLLLGSQLKKVEKSKDVPIMLIPFNHKDMVDFFLVQAKSLEKDIFK